MIFYRSSVKSFDANIVTIGSFALNAKKLNEFIWDMCGIKNKVDNSNFNGNEIIKRKSTHLCKKTG